MNVPASALRTVGMLFDTLGEVKELDLQSVSPELRPAALYKYCQLQRRARFLLDDNGYKIIRKAQNDDGHP